MESGNYKLAQNKTNLKNYKKFITNNLVTKGIIIQYKVSAGPEGYLPSGAPSHTTKSALLPSKCLMTCKRVSKDPLKN